MRNQVKDLAFLGLCTALALILAYAEVLLPPLFPSVPGIKMGLPNIMVIFILYHRGARAAVMVSIARILLVTLLFGNAASLAYSLAGAALSLSVMVLLRRMEVLSTIGVSVAGAVMHNVGQVLTAMLLLETAELGYYLVVLTLTGTIAGVFIGLCGAMLIKRLPQRM